MRTAPTRGALLLALPALVAVLGACGGDGSEDGGDLSASARRGREIVSESGCAVCHGPSGEGGTGPAFVGLAGSEVELEDGSTVVADREYLSRSISDPGADEVAGYSIRMPPNSLTDEEIAAVVDYIEALS